MSLTQFLVPQGIRTLKIIGKRIMGNLEINRHLRLAFVLKFYLTTKNCLVIVGLFENTRWFEKCSNLTDLPHYI